MTHLSRIMAFALSTAVLGFVIAGCQPQGGAPASQATESAAAESAAAEATAADEPINVMTGSEQILEGEQLHALDAVSDKNSQLMTVAEMRDLLFGNTIIGSSGAWNMTWSEYFDPDGTTKVRLRFEGQDDVGEATGIHYFNSKGQLCTDPEGDLGPYCKWLRPLGNGKYEQVYEQAGDGEPSGDIYEQILEGDQVDAFK